MKRYLRILGVLARYNFIHQTTYRPSFFLAILGKGLRVGLFIAFADAIFRNVPGLAGWTPQRAPLLILTMFLVEFLIGVTFHRNLMYFFYEWLHSGEYDYMIIRPINTIFLTAFRVIDFFDVLPLVVIVCMITWYIFALHIPLTLIFGYAIIIFAACAILFSVSLLLSSILFHSLIPNGLGRIYESIVRLNRFPLDALPKFWRVALFYVVPVAVAGNIPAKFLIGTWSWAQLLYIVVFAVAIFYVAVKFWYYALRHYSSVA